METFYSNTCQKRLFRGTKYNTHIVNVIMRDATPVS